MTQFAQTQKSPAAEKAVLSGVQTSPYKVYAHLECVRSSDEVCLEVIDGYLKQPESLVMGRTEMLKGGIYSIHLSITEKEEYSTYFRSEPIKMPKGAHSFLIKVFKKNELVGIQHIDRENALVGTN